MPKETELGNLLAAHHGLQTELESLELPWLELHKHGLQQTIMAFDRLKHRLVLENGVWRLR
jgi:hypothetical protein